MTHRLGVRGNRDGPWVSNFKLKMIAERMRDRAKKSKYDIRPPFHPHLHSSFSLELFASLYAVAKAAVRQLLFRSLSLSFSFSLLFFFSVFSCLGVSLRVPFLLKPWNAFPSQLDGWWRIQCPSHLPPVSLEHQYHWFPFHTLERDSCSFCGFSLLVSHLGRCGFVFWFSFFF